MWKKWIRLLSSQTKINATAAFDITLKWTSKHPQCISVSDGINKWFSISKSPRVASESLHSNSSKHQKHQWSDKQEWRRRVHEWTGSWMCLFCVLLIRLMKCDKPTNDLHCRGVKQGHKSYTFRSFELTNKKYIYNLLKKVI